MERFNPFEQNDQSQKTPSRQLAEERKRMQLAESERRREYRDRDIETDTDIDGRVFPVVSERNRAKGIEGMRPDERGRIDWQNSRRELESDIFSRPPQQDVSPEIDREISELRAKRTGINQFVSGRQKQLEEFDKEQGFQFERVPGGEEGEIEDRSETGRRVESLLRQKGKTLSEIMEPRNKASQLLREFSEDPEVRQYRLALEKRQRKLAEIDRAKKAYAETDRRFSELQGQKHLPEMFDNEAAEPVHDFDDPLAAREETGVQAEPFDEPGQSPQQSLVRAPYEGGTIVREGDITQPLPHGFRREAEPAGVPGFIAVRDIPLTEEDGKRKGRILIDGKPFPRESEMETVLPDDPLASPMEGEPEPFGESQQKVSEPDRHPDKPDLDDRSGGSSKALRLEDRRDRSAANIAAAIRVQEGKSMSDLPEDIDRSAVQNYLDMAEGQPEGTLQSILDRRLKWIEENAGGDTKQEKEKHWTPDVEFDEEGRPLTSGYIRNKSGDDLFYIDEEGAIYPNAGADPREIADRMVEVGVSKEDAEKILMESGWIKHGDTGDFIKDFRKPTVQDRMDRGRKEDDRPGAPAIPAIRTGMESRELDTQPIGSRWHPEFQKVFLEEQERIRDKIRTEVGEIGSDGFWRRYRQTGWGASFGNIWDLAVKSFAKAQDLEVPFGNPNDLSPAQIREQATMLANLALSQEIAGYRDVDSEAPTGFAQKAGTAAGFMAGLFVDPAFRATSGVLRGPRTVSVALPARNLGDHVARGTVAGAKAGAGFAATHPPVVWLPEKGEFSEAWSNQAIEDIAGFAAFGGAGSLVTRMASPAFWRRVNLKPAEASAELIRIAQKFKGGQKLTPEESKLMEQFIGEVRARAQKGDFSRFDPEFQVWRPRKWVEQVPFLNDMVRTEVGIRAHERGRLGEGKPRLTEPRPAEPVAGSRTASRQPGGTPGMPQPKTAAERVKEGFEQPKRETPATPEALKPSAPAQPKADAPKPEAEPKSEAPVRAPGIRSPKISDVEGGAKLADNARRSVDEASARIETLLKDRIPDLPEIVMGRSKDGLVRSIFQSKYNDFMHPKNAETRAIFEEMTGVKLPETAKETREFFNSRKGEAFSLVEPTVVPGLIDEEDVSTALDTQQEISSPVVPVKQVDSKPSPETSKPAEVLTSETPSEVSDSTKAVEGKDVQPPKPITDTIRDSLLKGEPVPRKRLTELAKEAGVEAKEADELAELGVVQAAREIAQGKGTRPEKFDRMVQLYENQPNLTAKTSTSKINQAYSTPAPLAYLAGEMIDIRSAKIGVGETSAGNGMLVIGSEPGKVFANEIDPRRAANLKSQGFAAVTQLDATTARGPQVDRISINPPFGAVMQEDGSNKKFSIEMPDGRTLETTNIDHAIVLNSLIDLTPDGKAALIIGGHKGADDLRANKYNTKQNREFFYFLHENYNVVDHFTIDGDLYTKQGAGWPVDMIIIDGKGKSGLPLPAVQVPPVLTTWSDVRNKLPAESAEASPQTETGAVRRDRTGSGEGRRPDAGQRPASRPRESEPERVSGEPAPPDGGRGEPVPPRDRIPQPTDGRDSGVEGQPEAKSRRPSRVEGKRVGDVSEPAPERRRPVRVERVGDFQSTYTPSSKGQSGGTITPSNLAGAQNQALDGLRKRVGDIDTYVREKLGYKSDKELHKAFFAEQVDALGLAIESIESGRGFIVGDQTGVGKGRIAAGIIRYAVREGINPVFVTAKKDLYNDMLRDLAGIGNKDNVIPYFTDNNFSFKDGLNRQWKTGNQSDGHLKIIDDGVLPGSANVIFTTYSQIGSDVPKGFSEGKKEKAARQKAGKARPDGTRMQMLRRMAENSIFILDESHKGAGDGSEVNIRLLQLLEEAKGAYYSSATYAKNPDAIPLYFKTSISDSGLTPNDLVDVMGQGGVPLQQFVSNMLAQDGQYLRRERSFEGIDFKEVVATSNENRDRELADRYTDFMNQLVFFWRNIDRMVKVMDKEAKKAAQQITGRKADGAVESMNFGSSLFSFTQQYLFALKADSIAKEAIAENKAGRKVVIAVQNTNEGPINDIAELGEDLNFNGMLLRTLENILWVRKKIPGVEGTEKVRIEPESMPDGGAMFYELQEAIKEADFGDMPLSPIDHIRQQLEEAGIPTGEITGRKTGLNADGELYNRPSSEVKSAGKIEAMRQFNNGGIDALIINSSGSTGFSLHSAKEYKDQRQRVMIVGQAQLDINEFMQTLGRIHRAGQVVNPVFRILSTALPAEKRLSSMLRRKMAMLNANTTSNVDTDISAQSDSSDIFNKYGDEVMLNVLRANPAVVELIPTLFPAGIESLDAVYESIGEPGEFARKVTGHLVLTPIADQDLVWANAIDDYTAHINYLNEIGENDLIVQPQDYQAETISSRSIFESGDGETAFSSPAYLETVKIKSTKKPLTVEGAKEIADGRREEVAEGFKKYKEAMQRALADEIAKRKKKSKDWTTEKEDAIRTSFNAAFSQVAGINRLFGRPVSVGSSPEGRILGVVTNIKFDLEHPRSISRQMVEVQVNTSKQRLQIPISKGSDIQAYEGYEGTFSQDWEATKETSSIKRIVTGNLLAGYKFLKDQGQSGKMITYTTKKGDVTQGIELPANAAIGEVKVVKSSDELWEVITGNNRVFSSEGVEFVMNAKAEIELRTPSSKTRGGKFWQNPALNKMLREGEFREIGGMMRGAVPRENLETAFKFLTSDLGQQLVYTPKKSKGGVQGAPAVRDNSGFAGGIGSPEFKIDQEKLERIPVAPIYGGTPKKLKDIVLDFGKATKVKVRVGKTPSGLAGAYYPSSTRTLIRASTDLNLVAHEVAHNLDDRFGIVSEWAESSSSPFDGELAPFWEHGSVRKTVPRSEMPYKRAEGVAEWIRAYIVNPEEAIRQAPRFYQFFLQQVPADMRSALDSFGREVREFAGLPAHERTLQNVQFDPSPPSLFKRIQEAFQGSPDEFRTIWMDKLHAALVDDMGPVWKGMEYAMRVRGIEELLPSESPKLMAHLLAGFNRKIMDVYSFGPITADRKRVEGFPDGVASLFSPFDKSSTKALNRDIKDTVGLMINERIIEKAHQIDMELADGVRKSEIRRLEARRVSGEITSEEFQEIVAELRAAKTIAEMVDLLDQEYWEPKLPRIEAIADKRKSQLAGTGGGVYKDHEQAVRALKELQASPERLARLEAGAKLYRKWSGSLLRYMRDKGRISHEQYQQIVDNNEYYVAMRRIQDDIYDGWTNGLTGKRLARAKKVIHRFKGSMKTVKNPYVTLLEQTAIMMREADRNEVMGNIRNLLTSPRRMHEGVARNLDQIGRRVEKGEQGAIKIYHKGEEEFWKFEDGMNRALNDWFDPYLPSFVEKFAQIPRKILHTSIVHSPDFIIRSTVKDPAQRTVVSRVKAKPWDSFSWLKPENFKEYQKWLSEFNRDGGGLFGHHMKSEIDYYKEMRRIMKKEAKEKDPTYIFTLPFRAVQGWSNLAANTEIMGRLTEYRRAVSYGMKNLGYDRDEAGLWAAWQARGITDYAVAGRVVKSINRYIPFVSAHIRGVMRDVEMIMGDGGGGGLPPDAGRGAAGWGKGKRMAAGTAKMIGRILAYMGSISAASWVWNQLMGDDEEYLQHPAYVRDMFYLFKIGDDRWFAFPKSWELGTLSSGIERGLEYVSGNEKAFEDYGKSLKNIMAPIDEQAMLGSFKVYGEVIVNRDLFRDRMIVPYWEEALDLDLRKGTDRSSRIGQAVQSMVGMDARNVDHIIGGQFGGLGRYAMDISDAGREDRRGLTGLGEKATGLIRNSPAWNATDVQWVFDHAKRRGISQSRDIRDLRELLIRYSEASTRKERDESAKRARDYATKLRAKYEQEAKDEPRRRFNPFNEG